MSHGCGSSGVSCRPAKTGPAAARQAASRAPRVTCCSGAGCRVPGGAWDRPGVTLGRLGPARCGIGPVTARSVGPALTPQEPHPCDIAVVRTTTESHCRGWAWIRVGGLRKRVGPGGMGLAVLEDGQDVSGWVLEPG